MNILVVEDEKRLSEALVQILHDAGYHTDAVYDGQSAVDYAESELYDAIILDVMLPRKDGFEVVHELRRNSISTPVLFLTARSTVSDKVTGLDRGGDVYMTKPFQPEELLANLRAITRRKGEVVIDKIDFGDLSLDIESSTLECGDRQVHLSYTEYEIVHLFMCNPNQVISKDQMLVKIWGTEPDVAENNVEAYISFVRKKMKFLKTNVEIATLRKLGYRLQVKEG